MFLPARIVAYHQFLSHVLNAQSLGGQQHDEVINHVRAFIDEALVCTVHRFDDRFQSFFAHFLCHAVQTVLEQTGGVRAFRHFAVSFLDEILQLGEEQQRVHPVLFAPAGVGAGVAYRAHRVYTDEQCVLIAVVFNGNYVQEVSAFLSLGPPFAHAFRERGAVMEKRGIFFGE